MDITIGTFNLNNLFDRFNFRADLGSLPASDRQVRTTYQWSFTGRGTGAGDPAPQLDEVNSSTPIVRIQRNANGQLMHGKPMTAQQAIADRIDAIAVDVLAVQEVENLDALRRFNRDVLANPYPFEVHVEGNDPRFIDVALLSRLPVARTTSHRHEVHPDDPQPVFGRDLLQVDVMTATRSRRLCTLFVNHMKSSYVRWNDPDPEAAAARNDLRRRRQAEVTARVVQEVTRPDSSFVLLGDFNDAPDGDPLAPMVDDLSLVDALADVVESQPPPAATNPEDAPTSPRWTHRWSRTNSPDHFELFDQVWLSPRLADHLDGATIERRRAWTAAAQGVGSDHDPAWIQLRDL